MALRFVRAGLARVAFEWESGGSHERGVAMVGFVRCSLSDEACERMDFGLLGQRGYP